MRIKSSRWGELVLAVLTLLVFSLPAAAQTDAGTANDDPFAGIEEMVVVAEAGPLLFQQEEVSAISFDSNYLDAIGAQTIADIAQFTPNLEIRSPFTAANPTFFIRGVGLRSFNSNSSSSVAIYTDEVYMNSPAGQVAQLFDIQDLAVLRGPQGTEYARNASAGTIRIITRKPTGTPGARLEVTYGRFNEIGIEGAIESVLIPGVVSMRTSGRLNRRDGITKNRCGSVGYFDFPRRPPVGRPETTFASSVYDACFNSINRGTLDAPFPPQVPGLWQDLARAPVKRRVNDKDDWAARTILRITPDFHDMEWLINFHGGKNRGDSRQFQVIGARQDEAQIIPSTDVPTDADSYVDLDINRDRPGSPFRGDPFAGDYNIVPKDKLDLFGVNAVGKITLGDFAITSVTAYEWNKRRAQINLDGNPFPSLQPIFGSSARQVSQELRIDWDGGDGLKAQLGGMYLYESLDVSNIFSRSFIFPAISQRYSFFTRYGAVWATAEFAPVEEISVKAGLRLNHEDKEINIESESFFTSRGVPTRPRGDLRSNGSAARETALAGDVTLSYLPTEDVTLYLRYARGWKGPHINAGVINPNATTDDGESLVEPVAPERVDSVELGLKSRFWQQRATLNGALFYYDYQDIQIFRLRNSVGGTPVQQLINAEDADVLGVELEVGLKPFEGLFDLPWLDGLWIHTNFAWLDSKYTDFVNTQTGTAETGAGLFNQDFSGNRLVNSPEFSFVGFVAWALPTPWGAVVPRFDWSFKDQIYFSPANAESIGQDPLWLLNVRLTYKSPSGRYDITGWVENLTDQSYILDTVNLARFRRAILYAIGDPRTYGVTLNLRF